jgi:hypothetical protein
LNGSFRDTSLSGVGFRAPAPFFVSGMVMPPVAREHRGD